MNSVQQKVLEHCDLLGRAKDLELRFDLPHTYREVASTANGFVTRDGFFRFFGTEGLGELPSVEAWNCSAWKHEYGDIFFQTFIFSEDIFGDQYGLVRNENESHQLLKIYCEGGKREHLPFNSVEEFLMRSVLVDLPTTYDYALAVAARAAGILPCIGEHLAFSLPLIAGGAYDIENLTREPVALHLGVLAQMTRQNASLSDGSPIGRFDEV